MNTAMTFPFYIQRTDSVVATIADKVKIDVPFDWLGLVLTIAGWCLLFLFQWRLQKALLGKQAALQTTLLAEQRALQTAHLRNQTILAASEAVAKGLSEYYLWLVEFAATMGILYETGSMDPKYFKLIQDKLLRSTIKTDWFSMTQTHKLRLRTIAPDLEERVIDLLTHQVSFGEKVNLATDPTSADDAKRAGIASAAKDELLAQANRVQDLRDDLLLSEDNWISGRPHKPANEKERAT